MLNRTLILGTVAVIAIAVGVATSFFELIVLGVVAAIVGIALGLRQQPTNETQGR